MAIIGSFKKNDDRFEGIIRTLAFTSPVTIQPTSGKRGEKSPDYLLLVQSLGFGEIGAAWNRSKDGSEYLSVRIENQPGSAPSSDRAHSRLPLSPRLRRFLQTGIRATDDGWRVMIPEMLPSLFKKSFSIVS